LTEISSGSNKRDIGVIEAYFDESGTHKGAKVLCVAGYIGDRKKWSLVLKKFNIAYFHAKDPRCNPLRPYLAKLIINSDLVAIAASINPADYKIFAGEQFKSTLGNPYSICTFACAIHIKQWLKDQDRVSIIIEHGQPNAEHVEKMLKSLIDEPIYQIASVGIASKKEFLPLQTADFLAHVISTQDIKWINRLVTKNNILSAHIRGPQIISMSKQIKELIDIRRHIRKQRD